MRHRRPRRRHASATRTCIDALLNALPTPTSSRTISPAVDPVASSNASMWRRPLGGGADGAVAGHTAGVDAAPVRGVGEERRAGSSGGRPRRRG
ncbi:hypothetical protein EI982_14750 [Haloplanus rallus]|uniref:Uncharacterized protein n=1 Tax=Haloplanus rallus TaxID=1816183 RepID=A0A6B9FFH9_9EURY|nr:MULTISPECIES: hypothetical protein [Haloplanus]QGX95950.1 hypothetical protein EI982_14750 [Haloplanus rallus]